MSEKIVAPSLLAADFMDLKTELKRIEVAGATWLHYDVMDGVFVDNISFGPEILKQIKKFSDLYMDVHLMISRPAFYTKAFIEAGADSLTFHVESFESVEEGVMLLKQLTKEGIDVGITLRPHTPLEQVVPYLKFVDQVLVMSVEPGFGGQSFILSSFERIEELIHLRDLNNYNYKVSVDGGINNENGKKCREAGADILVAGSYIFKSENIEQAVQSLL